MHWSELFRAFALVLIIEGLMPFITPRRWRGVLLQVASMDEKSLRTVGLILIATGAFALNFL